MKWQPESGYTRLRFGSTGTSKDNKTVKIGKRLADDITTLIVLITETVDDLDSGEQKALRSVATVIDRIKNRQTLSNPFLPRNSIKRGCTGDDKGKECFF